MRTLDRMSAAGEEGGNRSRPRWHGVWRWVGIVALVAVGLMVVAGEVLVHRVEPILRGRLIRTLSARFHGRVELDELHVSLAQGLAVVGGGLRIYPPDDVASNDGRAGGGAAIELAAPVISIRQFEFRAGIRGLFAKSTRVRVVHVTGLRVVIVPRPKGPEESQEWAAMETGPVTVDEIVCDDSELVIGTAKAGKEPKRFALRHVVLRDVGTGVPWAYDALLVNAVPRGEIHAVGTFGPWLTESSGNSALTGRYEFAHADLGTIVGIGGTLHSVGEYTGRLNRIEVKGTTETPDFWLASAKHRMPLETRFRAIVDGTTGDTYLDPVQARLGRSNFTCRGTVVNVKGVGHAIDMEVDVPEGRIQDFLQLSVRTEPPVVTGILATRAKLHIGPGKESVPQKLQMQGGFRLTGIHFTNEKVTDKVDDLSMRAQGYGAGAKPGAPVVQSEIRGTYVMGSGRINLKDLQYTIPGATVALAGVYSMDGEQFDFQGTVRTKAKLSDMVQTWWKQILLYPLNQVLQKNGAGMEIPVTISGTKGEPKFGLDLKKLEGSTGQRGVGSASQHDAGNGHKR